MSEKPPLKVVYRQMHFAYGLAFYLLFAFSPFVFRDILPIYARVAIGAILLGFWYWYGGNTVVVFNSDCICIKYSVYGPFIKIKFADIVGFREVEVPLFEQFKPNNLSTNFLYHTQTSKILKVKLQDGQSYCFPVRKFDDFLQAINNERYKFSITTT